MNNIIEGAPQLRSVVPVNAMTVDVEDYFQVSAFQDRITRADWDSITPRVERNTERVLEIFEAAGVSATFFTLGWVGERFPGLVRHIAEAGHEIGSHGMDHTQVSRQTREEFGRDIARSKKILEDITGEQVRGYRAASYSISADTLWALDCLQEAGYVYSSSIYPVRHDLYGMPEAPRFAFRLYRCGLWEVPVTTVAVAGRNLHCGGGGFFRLYPYALSRWAIRRVNAVDEQPAIFYFHPWEIDPKQPRVRGLGPKTWVRHYFNLHGTEKRIKRLLSDFRWDRMDRVFLRRLIHGTPVTVECPGDPGPGANSML